MYVGIIQHLDKNCCVLGVCYVLIKTEQKHELPIDFIAFFRVKLINNELNILTKPDEQLTNWLHN
jgi:hypothetical protein